MCRAKGLVYAANVCDHVVPHHGDPKLFWDSTNLQSLCAGCHDAGKRQVERSGFSRAIGPSGWPEDPRHPVYRFDNKKKAGGRG